MSASLVIISLVKFSCWWVSSWGLWWRKTVLSLHSLLVKSFKFWNSMGQIYIFFLGYVLGESPDFPWIFPWIQAEFHRMVQVPVEFFGPSNAPGHEATEEVPRARVRAECGAEHVAWRIRLVWKSWENHWKSLKSCLKIMGKWWGKASNLHILHFQTSFRP